jgi:hypothetical protein
MNNEALWPVNFPSTPGTVVALALSGDVDDYSMTVVLAVNVVFHASLTCLLLRAHQKKA